MPNSIIWNYLTKFEGVVVLYQLLKKYQSFMLSLLASWIIICIGIVISFPSTAEAAIQEYNLSGHTGLIHSIDISPDGRYLVSGGEDCVAIVWDLSNGSMYRTLTSYTEIDSKNRTHTIQGHKKEILSTVFSPNSNLIVTGDYDGHIKIWSTDTGKVTLSIDSSSGCFAEKISNDGTYLAEAGVFDNVTFWNMNTGKYDGRTLGVTELPFHIAFSYDNNLVAVGNEFGKVQIWLNKSGSRPELRTLSQNKKWNSINEITFSPDNKLLVAGSSNFPDKTRDNLKLWEVDTGRLVWSTFGDTAGINSVAFSPNGKNIMTLGESLKVWDTSGSLLKEIPLKSIVTSKYRAIQKVRILDDGRIIACRSDGSNIKVWIINEE